MFKELLARFRKPKEPVVDEKALEEERERQKQKEIVENYYKERAQRLADVCQQLQLSMEELKEKLDITEEMIVDFASDPSETINDIQENTSILLYKLLNHANVNPVYLIGGAGGMFLQEEEAHKITILDFGEFNADVISLIAFMIVSPMFRLCMLAESRRIMYMNHDLLIYEFDRFKSNLEEKKG